MLIVSDLYGQSEPLIGFTKLKRKRKVNGERTIRFILFSLPENELAYPLVQQESLIELNGEEYRIKYVKEYLKGKSLIKEVEANHTFFDLINSRIYTSISGSKSLNQVLDFIFNGTEYTYSIVDSFPNQTWEELGEDNRLSLLQDALKSYSAEFERNGKHLTFKNEVGSKLDVQFRFRHNIKAINHEIDSNDLATYIKGYGKDGLEIEYYSPHYDKYDMIHEAPEVRDDRYTHADSLLERLKNEIDGKDQPKVSITVDYLDLRRNGYPYEVVNEGDYILLIHEKLGMDLESRIVEIEEEFNLMLEAINTTVTLSNYSSNTSDDFVEFSKTQKQVKSLFDGNKKLPYSVLDEAVRRSTEAIQSAQTELEFINGLIGRSKDNPNHLTVFNSAGLGVSRDGGQTFRSAITSEGVVAESIVGGSIIGVNLSSQNEEGLFRVHGSSAEFLDIGTGRNVKISPDGLFGYDVNGDIRFRADKLLVTSAALGTSNSNVYLAADSNNEVRVVDVNSIPSDGVAENYSYRPIRAQGLRFGPGANGYIGTEGEVRITSSGFVREDGSIIYRPLRAGAIYSNNFVTTSTSLWMGTDSAMHVVNKGFVENSEGSPIYRDIHAAYIFGNAFVTQTDNAYIGANGELRVQNKGLDGIYRSVRALGYYGEELVVNNGTNLYLGVLASGDGEVRVTNSLTYNGGNIGYRPIRASEYRNGSSIDYKTHIEDFTDSGLNVINNLSIKRYALKEDVNNGIYDNWQIGVISELSPEVSTSDGKSVNLYKMLSYTVKSIQELSDEVDLLKQRVSDVEMTI